MEMSDHHHKCRRSFDGHDCRYAEQIFAHHNDIIYQATHVGGAESWAISHAVKFNTDNEVTLADTGSTIIGKLLEVYSDGTCLVQVGGYAMLPTGDTFGSYFAPQLRTTAVGAKLSTGGGASQMGYVGSSSNSPDDHLGRPLVVATQSSDPNYVWVDFG